MHTINLEDKIQRLDLINDIPLTKKKVKKNKNTIIEKIFIDEKESKRINKQKGNYISILFKDITDSSNFEKVLKSITKELKELLTEKNLINKSSLIVGLGNDYSTPDSLGPRTIKNIIATRHLYEIGDVDSNYSCVAKIAPGVFSNSGIETYDILKGIVDRINPDFLIIIDALSSTSIEKINKVIQITDSSIEPGSGVGNVRKELSKNSLGREIIVIGIPTVVNLHTIVRNFLSEYDVDEILIKKGNNFMVTPKEIDFEIERLSLLLAKSINNVLHNMTN